MSKKITLKNCQELAEKRNGKCLSTEYIDNKTPLIWECEYGHQWPAPRSAIQQKNWCPDCGGTKKKTIEYCHKLAEKNGGKCLSSEYVNNTIPLIWECGYCGHIWPAKCSTITNGHWCKPCGMKKVGDKSRLSIEDCQNLAKKRDGKCLSLEYVDAISILLWECKYGHIFESRYNDVQQGHWCGICGRTNARDTCKKRYGVDNPMKSPEIARKSAKNLSKNTTSYHWKTGEELICRSSWEEKVIAKFNEEQKNFLWESKTFAMPDGRTYTPDCYLPDEDLWIEIKGRFIGDAEEKWDWFQSEYPNSELWNKEKLRSLSIL